jgi:uncharacterized protein (DUF2237 family)
VALTTTGPSLPDARDAVLRGSFGSEEPRTMAESAPCALQLRNSGNGCRRRDAGRHGRSRALTTLRAGAILGAVTDRNVLGGELETCGTDPVTGFYRDGCCATGPEDRGSHTICAVVTAEFLEHQRRIGNDLSTPMPYSRSLGTPTRSRKHAGRRARGGRLPRRPRVIAVALPVRRGLRRHRGPTATSTA